MLLKFGLCYIGVRFTIVYRTVSPYTDITQPYFKQAIKAEMAERAGKGFFATQENFAVELYFFLN